MATLCRFTRTSIKKLFLHNESFLFHFIIINIFYHSFPTGLNTLRLVSAFSAKPHELSTHKLLQKHVQI